MSTATTPLRSLFTARTRRAPVAVDPADMGTCFGLEMTLTVPVAEAPAPAPQARSWWQRLSSRKAAGT
jgi:hypothetical protein